MKNNQMIEYKESFYEKIINKIKGNKIIEKLLLKLHFIHEKPELEEKSKEMQTSNSFKDNLKEYDIEQIQAEVSSDDIRKALAEVRIVLSGYDKNLVNQIPQNFLNFIEDEYDKNYNPNIDRLKNINKQNLTETTRVILAIIYKKYLMNYKES